MELPGRVVQNQSKLSFLADGAPLLIVLLETLLW